MEKIIVLPEGPGAIKVWFWEIDESKPKAYIEGHFYKFNNQLVKALRFKSTDERLLKLKDLTCK